VLLILTKNSCIFSFVLIVITTSIIGVFLYLYFFWKRLKDDYIRNQIFTTAFYGLVLLGAGYFTSLYVFGNLRFWLSLTGTTLGFALGIFRYRLKILEVFEAAVLGLLSIFALILVGELIVTHNIIYLFSFIVLLLLIILFHLLDKYYKGFAWYKSGRIGFSGLTVSGVFFLIYTVVAITLSSMISFVGNKDFIISFLLSILSFSVVYKLARQKS
jgi:hypothetical protein